MAKDPTSTESRRATKKRGAVLRAHPELRYKPTSTEDRIGSLRYLIFWWIVNGQEKAIERLIGEVSSSNDARLKVAVYILIHAYLDWLQPGTIHSDLVRFHLQKGLPRKEWEEILVRVAGQVGNPVFGKTWDVHRDNVVESLQEKYPDLTSVEGIKRETIHNIFSWTEETLEEATFDRWAFGKATIPKWLYEIADLHHKSPRRPIRRKRVYKGRRRPTTEQEQARRHLKRRLEDALLKGTLGDDFRKKEVKTVSLSEHLRGDDEPDNSATWEDFIPDPKAGMFRNITQTKSVMSQLIDYLYRSRLSQQQRMIYLLSRQGYPPRDIAALVGSPPGSVRVQLSRAKLKMKRYEEILLKLLIPS